MEKIINHVNKTIKVDTLCGINGNTCKDIIGIIMLMTFLPFYGQFIIFLFALLMQINHIYWAAHYLNIHFMFRCLIVVEI